VSVIILALFKSIESTLAVKFPFSVATVIVLKPAPGGPETAAIVAFGVEVVMGFGVGVAALVGIMVGVGEAATLGVGVTCLSGRGLSNPFETRAKAINPKKIAMSTVGGIKPDSLLVNI